LKLERWGLPLFQERYLGAKACDRRQQQHIILTTIIIIYKRAVSTAKWTITEPTQHTNTNNKPQ
jgi:hypothetical protein